MNDLILEEFSEGLHLLPCLLCVHNSSHTAKRKPYLIFKSDDGSRHIGKLSHTRRLNQYTVGRKLSHHLSQVLVKIPYQSAADAARIHLSDLDPGIFQKAGVNSHLTELILYEDALFILEGLGYQLFDKSCLSGSKEAGKNIYLCHWLLLFEKNRLGRYLTFFQVPQSPEALCTFQELSV